MRLMKHLRPLFIPFLAVALAAIINYFWLINAYIQSESMVPTIPKNAMILGIRGDYNKKSLEVGDVVFFRHKELGNNLLVKRVIALPGQIVELRQGRVYINGELLAEPYIAEFSGDDFTPLLVPEDCCFVLGDNREQSKDSRYWENPFVRFEDIEGKALFLWFPKFKRLS